MRHRIHNESIPRRGFSFSLTHSHTHTHTHPPSLSPPHFLQLRRILLSLRSVAVSPHPYLILRCSVWFCFRSILNGFHASLFTFCSIFYLPVLPAVVASQSFLFFMSAQLPRCLYILYNTFSLSRFLLHSCRTATSLSFLESPVGIQFCPYCVSCCTQHAVSLSVQFLDACNTVSLPYVFLVVHNTMCHCPHCVSSCV